MQPKKYEMTKYHSRSKNGMCLRQHTFNNICVWHKTLVWEVWKRQHGPCKPWQWQPMTSCQKVCNKRQWFHALLLALVYSGYEVHFNNEFTVLGLLALNHYVLTFKISSGWKAKEWTCLSIWDIFRRPSVECYNNTHYAYK